MLWSMCVVRYRRAHHIGNFSLLLENASIFPRVIYARAHAFWENESCETRPSIPCRDKETGRLDVNLGRQRFVVACV